MCEIESCDRRPVAHGLCAKHYMRQIRTGDPNTLGKPGREKSWQRLELEKWGLGTDWSPRTRARFNQAMEMLRATCDVEEVGQLIEDAQYLNGKLNVSKLQEIAFTRYLIRREHVSPSDVEWIWKIWKSTH